jgi:hypothetical protein
MSEYSPSARVFDNEDQMWRVVELLTGFECGRRRRRRRVCSEGEGEEEEQRPTYRDDRAAAPLLPLVLTFRSLRSAKRRQLGTVRDFRVYDGVVDLDGVLFQIRRLNIVGGGRGEGSAGSA